MPKKRKGERLPQIRQLPSGSWTAKIFMYTDESGKDHYQSVTSRDYDEVVRRLAQLRAERKETKQTDPKERLTVGDAIDRYIESKENVLSPATVRGYRIIREHQLQTIMSCSISELTQDSVQRAVNAEADHSSPKTVRNAYGLLSASLAVYAPHVRLSVRLPQKAPSTVNAPTEEEVMRMVEVSRGTDMEIPVLLGAFCGMRRSEIAGLRWEDVDLDAGVIRVRRAEVLGDDGEIHVKPPKTVTSARDILAPNIVIESLADARKTSDSDRVTKMSKPQMISNNFKTVLRRAGLEHYRFHDLRHYLVSMMIAEGVPKKYIADYVGHATENMIDRVYGHIMASKKDEVGEAVKAYFDALQKRNQKQKK